MIDCLEFDDRLRFGDAMLDIAFLAMDLDAAGARDLAVVLLDQPQVGGPVGHEDEPERHGGEQR